ncbi:Uncharacterised protein [Mycolicibacterium vanbaalenii]|uniref:Uncharacterized protein n=1 Tax=Mycolicibacterium vanbaalenii TaxID=110539 RepID=A0A5S9R6D0_MYCVN|nr:RusA family crossover junction endodeoxyribonuclease [Mycolicibacterium vanbaalenii]CAA0129284.1 Uncharacterised protein [Mycolicibacterium vanbaalenii]
MPTRLGERPVTTVADAARVGALLAALGLVAGEPTFTLTIPGVPYSKSRPRSDMRNRRVYHDPADVAAERTTAVYLRATVREPFTGNVALACLFYRPTRGVVDVDNLLKHVADAGNPPARGALGVLWADDCQCTAQAGLLFLDRNEPRTVVAVGVHDTNLTRDYSVPKKPKGALPLWD